MKRRFLFGTGKACSVALALMAALPSQAASKLTQFSLEELMSMEITSVAKKAQPLDEATAAIAVINREDIRRSGATNIPELLRQVPGVQVARIDASRYMVTMRGFSSRWVNKLLVLLDGRTLYTPLFGGVYWEAQDVLLEDVERIEVIRGPGGTLWGANAVNGVINIITRSSDDTQGTYLQAGAGSLEQGVAVRHGGALGESGHFRVYAKFDDHGELETASGGDAHDAWQQQRAGFRADFGADRRDRITVQGDYYDKDADQTLGVSNLAAGSTVFGPSTARLSGGNLLFRWESAVFDGEMSFQAYYDQARQRDVVLDQRIDTLDAEFQHRFPFQPGHELTWGLGYRQVDDDLRGSDTIRFTPTQTSIDLYSLFLQYEGKLDDGLRLTLGSKFEHNHNIGSEYQPSLRLLWQPTATDNLWAAVSRAVQTPTRAYTSGRLNYAVIAPFTSLYNEGNPNLKAQELVAWELGYRSQFGPAVNFDATVFYNRYDDLVTAEPKPFPDVLGRVYGNGMEGRTYGVELATDWQVNPGWRLHASYSRLEIELISSGDSSAAAEVRGSSPRNMAQLRSRHDLGERLKLDAALYHVGELSRISFGQTAVAVPAYSRFDLRLGWRLQPDLEVSLTGQNLLDDRHREYVSQDVVSSHVPRSVHGRVELWF